MEAQRETLQKKPQFLGLRDTRGESSQPDSSRLISKPNRFNPPGAGAVAEGFDRGIINFFSKSSLLICDIGLVMRRKVSTEDTGISKSVNFGATKFRPGRPPAGAAEANESMKKRLISDHSASEGLLRGSVQGRVTPVDDIFSASTRPEKGKFMHLSPIEDKGVVDDEKNSGKVNFDIILKTESKLHSIFEVKTILTLNFLLNYFRILRTNHN